MGSAKSNDSDLGVAVPRQFRPWNKRTRRLELLIDSLHVTFEIVRTLAILRLLIVPATTREISCRRMIRPRQSAITNAIAIHIFIASKTARFNNIFLSQDRK